MPPCPSPAAAPSSDVPTVTRAVGPPGEPRRSPPATPGSTGQAAAWSTYPVGRTTTGHERPGTRSTPRPVSGPRHTTRCRRLAGRRVLSASRRATRVAASHRTDACGSLAPDRRVWQPRTGSTRVAASHRTDACGSLAPDRRVSRRLARTQAVSINRRGRDTPRRPRRPGVRLRRSGGTACQHAGPQGGDPTVDRVEHVGDSLTGGLREGRQ